MKKLKMALIILVVLLFSSLTLGSILEYRDMHKPVSSLTYSKVLVSGSYQNDEPAITEEERKARKPWYYYWHWPHF
jgi:hypothetical protein